MACASLLPPVPAASRPGSFGGPEEEPDQPQGQHDERDSPQHVDREPDTEEDQGEQQDRDDEQHGKLLSIGTFLLPLPRKTNAFGIATIRRDQVTCHGGELVFDYLAKGAKHREQAVVDAEVQAVVVSLM